MREASQNARRYLAPALVVGALLMASVVVALLVWSTEREDAERANEALARQATAIAERQVELTAASLRGAEGVLRRSGPMPERGFRRYAREVLANTPFPALAWAPRVPARTRARFERTLKRRISAPSPPTENQPKGALRPAQGRNGAYYPIRFVHPDERGPRRVLGLDLLSEPDRAIAVRNARDGNQSTLTAPVVRARRASTSVIVVDPVYTPGSRLTNARQRRRAITGVLSGGIPAGVIENEIRDQIGEAADASIADDGHAVIAADSPGAEGESMSVDVLGRIWDVRVANVEEAAALPALAVGGAGLLLAALAAALFALAGRREQMLSRERDVAAGEAEAQRATATALQQAFLPPSLPTVPGVETAAVYAPGAEGLQVGGDFYDLFATGETWTAMIGDVSGKGARAAALTSLVRHTARGVADRGPVRAVEQVNEAVRRETEAGTFATLCVGSLRPGADGVDVAMVVAGHPPPLIARADGAIEPIQPTGPLVGVLDDIEVGETRLKLGPGETLFLYTDGLFEARPRGGEPLGEEGLRAALAEARGRPPREILKDVLARAAAHARDFPQDDVAILAIRAR
jgi:serine phosphatase RsbU (regulator of sigma subunit)/CHASE1-domain containing sensor protein